MARLDLVCGRLFSPLQALLVASDDLFNNLKQLADKALEILECKRIAPVYTRASYKGVCDYSMKGLTWIFATSLIIAFSGMVMVTLRAVLWNAKGEGGRNGAPEVEHLGVEASPSPDTKKETPHNDADEQDVTSQADTHGETHAEDQ